MLTRIDTGCSQIFRAKMASPVADLIGDNIGTQALPLFARTVAMTCAPTDVLKSSIRGASKGLSVKFSHLLPVSSPEVGEIRPVEPIQSGSVIPWIHAQGRIELIVDPAERLDDLVVGHGRELNRFRPERRLEETRD